MIRLRNRPAFLYPFCTQTVTVYHREAGEIYRTIYYRAFLDFKKVKSVDKTGSKDAMSFLLVVVGDADIYAGDKVILGEGPEVSSDKEWTSFIPANNPGLCVVSYVDKKRLGTEVLHVEAGG